MNISNKKIFSAAVDSAALALVGALLLIFGGCYDFDVAFGYFKRGSIYALSLYGVLILGVIVAVWIGISSRNQCSGSRALPFCKAIPIISVICGIAVAAYTVLDLFDTVNTVNDSPYVIINYISWILGIGAAISLFYTAYTGNDEPKAIPCLLAFLPSLYFAAMVLIAYFDRSIAVNSPVAILCQTTYIAFMLMFTAEAGIMLGRVKLYARYIFILCICTVLGGSMGIGCSVMYFMDSPFPVDIRIAVMYTIFAVYSAVRLFSACSHPVVPKASVPEKAPEKSPREELWEQPVEDIGKDGKEE